MPIVIGARRESDFTDPIGMLGDCHRRIEKFLHVLATVAGRMRGQALKKEERGAFETALRYFRAILARVESLEEEHLCADRIHEEVDRLGRWWLKDGFLAPEQASRLSELLTHLQDLYRHHIATEDNEVFPAAAAALSAADRESIGREMAARRGIRASS